LREAQARLEAVTKNVRLQERRIAELSEKLKVGQGKLKESQAQAGGLELDIRSRDEQIERLRTQQQVAKNNKEYQAFLIEIYTAKVDRTKAEEQALRVMEQVETLSAETKTQAASLETEQTKLAAMKAEVGDKVATIQAEIEQIKPERAAAEAAVPPKALEAFNRQAGNHDGEALAAVGRPDKRREEYICTGCHMDIVVDVYNRLHTRDEVIQCSSCKRILYIPDDLPVDQAVNKPKEKREPRAKKGVPAAMGRQSSAFDVLASMKPEEDETPAPGQQEAAKAQEAPAAGNSNDETQMTNQ
jgi:predicted  nucleic acid-binding Zn-ribbon protein